MRHLSRTAVAVAAALAMPVQAELLITEYIEGYNDEKALEITNMGSGSISLDGYQISQYYNGKTTASGSNVYELSGSLAAGDSLVLVNAKASAAMKALADKEVSGYALAFTGDDALVLSEGDRIVDSIGKRGEDPGSFWGTKEFGTQNNSLRRKSTVTSGRTVADSNFDPSVEWVDFPHTDISGLGCAGEDTCSDYTPYVPPEFTCPEGAEFTAINAIQGTGSRSPLITSGFSTTEDYYVKGIVTARGDGIYKGFYLESLDADKDSDEMTSEGLFVFTGEKPAEDIQPGVEVCTKGKVEEYFGLTRLKPENANYSVTDAGNGVLPAHPLRIANNETLKQALERYEGMKIVLDAESNLRVTRNFSFDYDVYRNNMVLAHKNPLVKPTQLYPAESQQATDLAAKNESQLVYVESDSVAAKGVIPYFSALNPDDGYIRVGDKIVNLEAVVTYDEPKDKDVKAYRLVVTNQLTKTDFVRDDDVAHERTDAPALVDQAGIKVASFNVLNFFTSYSEIGGPLNASCKDQADADLPEDGCNRGAKDVTEFQLQRTKIVNAMKAMDADIIGIMEMENNGFGEGSAINNLLDELNKELSESERYEFVEITDADAGKYAKEGADFAEQKYFGTDAIMVAMFYRPARVSLAGDAKVIVTPEQHGTASDSNTYDKYQRHSLLQGFNVPDQEEPLHIVVNHFKSKGSGCIEDVNAPDDLQGSCTEFRVSAAEVVGQAVSQLKGDVLVLGDLNSYGMEDPVLALTTIPQERVGKVKTAASTTLDGKEHDAEGRVLAEGAGLINLSEPKAFSYTYGGELGSLDHVLGNASVAGKVVDITDWHINSLESNMFEYSSKYTGELAKSENPFSASDHDPVIVLLGNGKGVADGVKVKPASDGESATLPVTVTKNDAGKFIAVTLSGASAAKQKSFGVKSSEAETVRVIHQVTQAEADSGTANVKLPADLGAGSYQAKLELYKENPETVEGQVAADLGSVTITVEKAAPTPEGTTAPEGNSSADNNSGSSSGGSFGFGALLALAGLGWTRRRRV